MPSLSTLLLFSGASLALLLLPGPAVLYIVARGASQGRSAALVSVAGIHTGTLVHVFAAVVGLSAVVVASATAFAAIKLVGAGYLIYLGVTSLRRRREPRADGDPVLPIRSLRRVYVDGVVLNILNPKTAVFFLAFVPQFIDVDAGSVTTQILALSALFVCLGFLTDGAFAVAAGWVGQRLTNSPTLERRKDLAAGLTYILLGLVTAVSGRPSTA